jgi:hypothetical protein
MGHKLKIAGWISVGALAGALTTVSLQTVARANMSPLPLEELQQLAAEHGLSDHLSSLFKWTPSIVSDQWESADPSITTPLLDAITTTANRPTFKIIENH